MNYAMRTVLHSLIRRRRGARSRYGRTDRNRLNTSVEPDIPSPGSIGGVIFADSAFRHTIVRTWRHLLLIRCHRRRPWISADSANAAD